ncbi:hypothetical protein BH11ACT7_BH11ACT7_21770 [soil metagenome]
MPSHVSDILPSVTAVLITVIFDGHLQLRPTQVQAADETTELVAYLDLGLGPRKPVALEQQSQPGLLRRLGPGIDKSEDALVVPEPTHPTVFGGHGFDFSDSDPRRIEQGVNVSDSDIFITALEASQIERRSRGRRHA